MPAERARKLGNRRSRSLPAKAEVPALPALAPDKDELPAPPDHLNKGGKALWELVLTRAGAWVGETDRALLVLACEQLDEIHRLRRKVQTSGSSYTDKAGVWRAYPETRMLADAEARYVKSLSLLGLTPADRSRLNVAEVQKQSELERLLASRSQRGA